MKKVIGLILLMMGLAANHPSFATSCPRKPYDGVCIQVITYASNPETGTCCQYPNPCVVPDEWPHYSNPDCSPVCTETLEASTTAAKTTIYFVGGGPRVVNLDYLDALQDGEAHFSKEADFVGILPDQPYDCQEKATLLSTAVMESARGRVPGSVLVPVRVQNCRGELFKDALGEDINPEAVARWIVETVDHPAVVVFGFSKDAQTPPLGEMIRILENAGLVVVPPTSRRSEEGLLESLLQAGREAASFQPLFKVAAAACCASNGGINQGGITTDVYHSPPFPCGDTSQKSRAIESLLSDMGYTQTLCSGYCSSGTCRPVSLTSGLQDNANLYLNNPGNGSCSYTAVVSSGGVVYFRAGCACVC